MQILVDIANQSLSTRPTYHAVRERRDILKYQVAYSPVESVGPSSGGSSSRESSVPYNNLSLRSLNATREVYIHNIIDRGILCPLCSPLHTFVVRYSCVCFRSSPLLSFPFRSGVSIAILSYPFAIYLYHVYCGTVVNRRQDYYYYYYSTQHWIKAAVK
jgi:hypothetical protein